MAERSVIDHSVESRYHDDGIHMLMVREQQADLPERRGLVVGSVLPWQQETTEASESRMLQHVVDAVVEVEMRRQALADRGSMPSGDGGAYLGSRALFAGF